MTYDALTEAIAEAERFLVRARALQKLTKQRSINQLGIAGSPESAATKRASLDLTRALARMRKLGY